MKIPFLNGRKPARKKDAQEIPFGKGEPDPVYLEQFKALRAKFEYKADMLNFRVVAVTSAVAGEGKTSACVNLATNLASAGRKKVLLIDMDLRKSDLARQMDLASRPGLSEFLAGSAGLKDIVRNSVVKGLYVIPAGTRVAASADLIAGERFRAFLKETRGSFDVVLLDTPPIIPVADTLILRDQADAFIFLFRAGFTPHALFRQAVEEIGEKQILGVILNCMEPQKERYYQKYYGKYYRKKGENETPK